MGHHDGVVPPSTVPELDPALAVAEGRFDPVALLSLWLARRTFWPLLAGGMAVAIGVAGGEEQELGSLGDAARALASPLAGLILAFALRVIVGWLALALAWPLTGWVGAGGEDGELRGLARRHSWSDRLQLTRAYRSLRWTHPVREVAVDRLGVVGRRFELADRVLSWMLVGSLAALTAAVVLSGT